MNDPEKYHDDHRRLRREFLEKANKVRPDILAIAKGEADLGGEATRRLVVSLAVFILSELNELFTPYHN